MIKRKEGEEDPKINKTLIKTFDSLSILFYKTKFISNSFNLKEIFKNRR